MNITHGKRKKAVKTVVYGLEGIGKTTFASKFPRPLFIDTEGSVDHFDFAKTDKPLSWTELISQVRYFNTHFTEDFDTLIIDTADWAEKLCQDYVSKKKGVDTIADVGGYGEGYKQNEIEFGKLLNLLQESVEKGVHIVLTAHTAYKDFKSPDEASTYQRFELKLEKKTSAMLKEWADMVLFLNYETTVITDSKTKKKTATGGTNRKMYTQRTAAWDAKNRFDLPPEVPFEYESIREIIESNMRDSAVPQAQPERQQPTQSPVQEAPKPTPQSEPKPEANAQASAHELSEVPDPALRQLMEKDGVSVSELKFTVASRGYYPLDTELENYDPDFIQGVLIGAWNKILPIIIENRTKSQIEI